MYDTATVLALVGLFLGLCLQFLALHKIRRIHSLAHELLEHAKVTRREAETLYTQLQCAGMLERLLEMPQGLPQMRGWAGSPDFLLYTARYALAHRPRVSVECGSGASTIVLGRCMQMIGAGHVFSLEHDSAFASATRAMLCEYRLDEWVTVIDAPLVVGTESTPWYDEDRFPEGMHGVELLVVDGPPESTAPLARYPALPRLLSRMAEAFAVIVDDASRPDETEMIRRWTRETPGTTAISIPAEKGLAVLSRKA